MDALMNRRRFAAWTGLSLAGLPLVAHADVAVDTLRILAGFAPGGTIDIVGRRVGDKLGGKYAKTVIVENRTGAGGQIAVQGMKSLPADGSAVLITPASMLMIYPHIYKKLAYDPFADVTPLCLACSFDFGFAVGPMVPAQVKTMADFFVWAKANPSQSNFGSPAAGSVPHFLGELVARAGGVDLRHVPYRGSQPAVLEMVGGQIAAVSAPIGEFLQQVAGGKCRLLATSGTQRNRFAPNVPTYAEQGLKDIQFNEWFGFFGPGKMPAETVARANAALREALAQKDVIDGLALLGLDAKASTAPELAALLKRDHDRWGPIVKSIGFTADS